MFPAHRLVNFTLPIQRTASCQYCVAAFDMSTHVEKGSCRWEAGSTGLLQFITFSVGGTEASCRVGLMKEGKTNAYRRVNWR